MTTLIEVCALLDRLCREHDIEPPAMELTFKRAQDRSRFEHEALKSLRDCSLFLHGPLMTGITEVHGIPLQLLTDPPKQR